jgi:hypothetical protein
MSCEQFHDASKIITRFAANKFMSTPPARVEMMKRRALQVTDARE